MNSVHCPTSFHDMRSALTDNYLHYCCFATIKTPPINLTAESVENIHHQGGTILGSSRGGFDIDKICNFIKSKKIKQLYVIGGDGTHRGAFKIHETCMERVRSYFVETIVELSSIKHLFSNPQLCILAPYISGHSRRCCRNS